MGDYLAKTFIVMFFVAFAVSASIGTSDLFENYYDDLFNVENQNYYDLLMNNIFTFNSVSGAIVVGAALLLAGASSSIVMAGLMLGAIIPMILTPMNMTALIGLPNIALYVVSGVLTIMLIVVIMRFTRGV